MGDKTNTSYSIANSTAPPFVCLSVCLKQLNEFLSPPWQILVLLLSMGLMDTVTQQQHTFSSFQAPPSECESRLLRTGSRVRVEPECAQRLVVQDSGMNVWLPQDWSPRMLADELWFKGWTWQCRAIVLEWSWWNNWLGTPASLKFRFYPPSFWSVGDAP